MKIDLSRKAEWSERDDLEQLEAHFDLAPGSDERWYLWWRSERTWVCSFPSLDVARHILVGDDWDGYSELPGWPRRDDPVLFDVVRALHEYREDNGICLQINLSETSTLLDFLIPLGLGRDYLFEIVDASTVTWPKSTIICNPTVTAGYCPLVKQYLIGGCDLEPRLASRMAPIVAK